MDKVILNVRLSKEELKNLKKKAKAMKMNLSAYIRFLSTINLKVQEDKRNGNNI